MTVQPRQHERQRLAQMADDELQFRETVEHAAQNDAHDVDRGLDVPAPARTPANMSVTAGAKPP